MCREQGRGCSRTQKLTLRRHTYPPSDFLINISSSSHQLCSVYFFAIFHCKKNVFCLSTPRTSVCNSLFSPGRAQDVVKHKNFCSSTPRTLVNNNVFSPGRAQNAVRNVFCSSTPRTLVNNNLFDLFGHKPL